MAVCALQCDTGAGIWGHVTNVPVSAGGTHRHCPATALWLSTATQLHGYLQSIKYLRRSFHLPPPRPPQQRWWAQEEEGEGRDVHLSVSTPALCSLCSALVTRHN